MSGVTAAAVTVIGEEDTAGGVYVLLVRLAAPVSIAFGGFHGGIPEDLDAGYYVYTGSARAQKGPSSLSSRLIRHATRSGDLPYHEIRPRLADAFDGLGLWNGRLPAGKNLFWNVDYLLDRSEAEIEKVLAVRTSDRREGDVARLVEDDEHTSYIVRGLGANDAPGNTHLLRLDAPPEWWASLPERVERLLTMPAGT